MSTTPTISEAGPAPYTVVGCKKAGKRSALPGSLSILVLGRSGRLFRRELLNALDKAGAYDILSVEPAEASYDVEQLVLAFPKVRFLLLHEEMTAGEQVSLGITESRGDYILVLWDDMRITTTLISSRLMEKIASSENLCAVPVLTNQKMESLPSVQAPAFFRNKLKVMQLFPKTEGMESLFPFDYAGIYNKRKFLGLSGYDRGLANPYWQKMDFGFRAHMWGERIVLLTSFKLTYLNDIPAEDTTPDDSYKFFFLKNLSIRFTGDAGTLPAGSFLSFLFKSGIGVFRAVSDFKEAKQWVEKNKFRFRLDAKSVTELWEIPQHDD